MTKLKQKKKQKAKAFHYNRRTYYMVLNGDEPLLNNLFFKDT